jgi:hypothetical protein
MVVSIFWNKPKKLELLKAISMTLKKLGRDYYTTSMRILAKSNIKLERIISQKEQMLEVRCVKQIFWHKPYE